MLTSVGNAGNLYAVSLRHSNKDCQQYYSPLPQRQVEHGMTDFANHNHSAGQSNQMTASHYIQDCTRYRRVSLPTRTAHLQPQMKASVANTHRESTSLEWKQMGSPHNVHDSARPRRTSLPSQPTSRTKGPTVITSVNPSRGATPIPHALPCRQKISSVPSHVTDPGAPIPPPRFRRTSSLHNYPHLGGPSLASSRPRNLDFHVDTFHRRSRSADSATEQCSGDRGRTRSALDAARKDESEVVSVTLRPLHDAGGDGAQTYFGLVRRPSLDSSIVSLRTYIRLPEGGQLSLAELREMAARQQQQIEAQQQLLVAKEQRLKFLKHQQQQDSQQQHGGGAEAEQQRLRALRDRVQLQELKLRRLRALRGQVDQQHGNNNNLSAELESIRALFNEKEKELSVAVAKVEELTRQLEDVRRGNSLVNANQTSSTLELDKLRKELVYRAQLNEQQSARITQQRETLSNRQNEIAQMDRRIAELQQRLHRKRLHNQELQAAALARQQQQQGLAAANRRPNVAAVEPLQRLLHQDNRSAGNGTFGHPNKNDPKYQTLPYNTKFSVKNKEDQQTEDKEDANHKQQSPEPDSPPPVDKHASSNHPRTSQLPPLPPTSQPTLHPPLLHRPSSSHPVSRNIPPPSSSNQPMPRPHDPPPHSRSGLPPPPNIPSPQPTTVNQVRTGPQQPPPSSANGPSSCPPRNTMGPPSYGAPVSVPLSSGLPRSAMPHASMTTARGLAPSSGPLVTNQPRSVVGPPPYGSISPNSVPVGYSHARLSSPGGPQTSRSNGMSPPQGVLTTAAVPTTVHGQTRTSVLPLMPDPSATNAVSVLTSVTSAVSSGSPTQSYVAAQHSPPYGPAQKPSASSQIPMPSRLRPPSTMVSPRGTLSNSSGTGPSSSPQQRDTSGTGNTASEPSAKPKPQPPPKPAMSVRPVLPPRQNQATNGSSGYAETSLDAVDATAPTSKSSTVPSKLTVSNHRSILKPASQRLPRPSTISRQRPAETGTPQEQDSQAAGNKSPEEELKQASKPQKDNNNKAAVVPQWRKTNGTGTRCVTVPPAFLFPEPGTSPSSEVPPSSPTGMPSFANSETGETGADDTTNKRRPLVVGSGDSQESPPPIADIRTEGDGGTSSESLPDAKEPGSGECGEESQGSPKENLDVRDVPVPPVSSSKWIKKGNLKTKGSAKNPHRVSFDPLALLLDAALEGELELVKKTAKEVQNPSAANDEGITALHNAICAGHFEIVKFLVEFGCDVNAQDSDGWTPLHCAASCNNLPMVKFLVEHGACIFATTLSDHETAAEKCEEDEEGFDGCSEYLYSIQEKLGILNGGVAYAVFSYEAHNPDELSFKEGDMVLVLRKGDDSERDWWWARMGDTEGYLPRNLLGLYPRVKPARENKDQTESEA
ncbi:apoptosis-stimulating of p53 protein 1-like [Ornithodoros turicata]|uniref:apoptosis-stimulating of p53 protein 1-like n=1 Tax=Ornithodoros turicata TaxID=34597 RepID=UPI0031393E1E